VRPVELEVLLLSAQDRLTNDEIAHRLDLSRKAVERHLTNAIYRLAWPEADEGRHWWKFW
jgi:DNA-binding CsgD family transcriptional regulator